MDKYKILKEYEDNLTLLQDILGYGSTDNTQLQSIGMYLFNSKSNKPFIGVYSSDKMPVLKNNQMCIANTDDEAGVHWVACYKYQNKTFVYDSYDRDVKSLSKHWKKKHNWINANKDRDQSYAEENCGERSIRWLISAHKNTPNKIKNII